MHWRRLPLLALLALLVAALSGCGARDESSSPPDIVIVVLDTVRRDRLSAYGYHRETSPELDRLRDSSRLYTNAYATSSWTAPSHASLFTGLLPMHHGATQEGWVLGGKFDTLAELLAGAGYQTVAAVGNPMLTPAHGFAQGFEVYEELWRSGDTEATDALTEAWVTDFLEERDRQRPLFLFINLIGAHSPFDSCGESCGLFGSPPDPEVADPDWRAVYAGDQTLADVDLRGLSDLYDAEVREVDRHLGGIVRTLDRELTKSNTFLAITSDHGENLGEHGHLAHVFSLYETTIQVPLLVRDPTRFEPGEDERPVQLHDLFPTVLRVAGVTQKEHDPGDSSLGSDHGSDLAGLESQRPVISEYYRPVQTFGSLRASSRRDNQQRLSPYWRRIRTVAQDGWKLHWGSDGRHELYELDTDPNELRNLIGSSEATARRLALETSLNALVARHGRGSEALDPPLPKAEIELDDETRERLRVMGYLAP